MGSTAIALVAAAVGVTGTLLAPVFAQRSGAKAQEAEFGRQQQAVQAQWDREQQHAELGVRRTCYIETNAAYRRYRTEQMNYLWHVHRGEVGQGVPGSGPSCPSRRVRRSADGGLPAVLAQLDAVAKALAEGYRRTKCLEEGIPDEGDTFEVIEAYLQWIWERWEEMRAVMRADLGQANSPAPPSGDGAL